MARDSPSLDQNTKTHFQAKHIRVNRLRNSVGQFEDLCSLQKSNMMAAFRT
ncbi:hypothetical protein DPMN_176152 [Dreissena polymorpha]|uniref:Uncharacterized protein n=1 Tax=Dreissena polymorpha TaxID=45954 RepID=A0A9D4E6E2_DREPO|nr:hypothetical protein DPMN_176152 [Dreissena polymorpha]